MREEGMRRGGWTSDSVRDSCEGSWMRAEEGDGVEDRPVPAEVTWESNDVKGLGRAEEEDGESGGSCVWWAGGGWR
jgi:hypothetical protein